MKGVSAEDAEFFGGVINITLRMHESQEQEKRPQYGRRWTSGSVSSQVLMNSDKLPKIYSPDTGTHAANGMMMIIV